MMMTIILVFFSCRTFFNVRFVWLFLLVFFSFFISSLCEYITFCAYSHSRASIPFGHYTISISCPRHRQYTLAKVLRDTHSCVCVSRPMDLWIIKHIALCTYLYYSALCLSTNMYTRMCSNSNVCAARCKYRYREANVHKLNESSDFY